MRSDEFMNAEEVARYLHLGKNTVYQLAKSGRISSYHVGRKLRFTLEDVEAYVASTHSTPSTPARQDPGPRGAGLAGGGPDGASEDGKDLVEAASFGDITGDSFVIAGADEAADVLASALNARGMLATRLVQGSYTALVNLYAGEADAAVVSLFDQASNSWNVSYARNLAPGFSVVVIRLCGRRQGLVVQDRNPKGLTTWGSLLREGVRLSNRMKGGSARVLLDEKLRALEARSETIEGYSNRVYTGSVAIRRVASGLADVAVGNEREARHVAGVQFVPLERGWTDIVIRKTPKTRPVIRAVKDILGSFEVRREFDALSPCDTAKLGAIVYES